MIHTKLRALARLFEPYRDGGVTMDAHNVRRTHDDLLALAEDAEALESAPLATGEVDYAARFNARRAREAANSNQGGGA